MHIFVLFASLTALPLLASISYSLIRKGELEGWPLAWVTLVMITVGGIAVDLPDSIVLIFGILPSIVLPIIGVHYVYFYQPKPRDDRFVDTMNEEECDNPENWDEYTNFSR